MSGERKHFIDQLGNRIIVTWPPQRIVSLVPSQTELLHHIGLENEVSGITKFCIHPASWFKTKTRVGGTKTINIETIRRLNPDLVIANREENDGSQIAALQNEFPVWVSDIKNLDDALAMILSVGEMCNKVKSSFTLVEEITKQFQLLHPLQKTRACYLIWSEPLMSVNGDTFIHDMMKRCGLENVFESRSDSRYPKIEMDQLIHANPELVLLSSEPFPFSEKHAMQLQELLPKARVKLVDGEMFSWYGSRLLKSVAYFNQLMVELNEAQ
ncbi:MAG: helical backbone metal receptor [Flavobacteriales bacterium]